jgi:hypothetical protein
MIQYCVIPIVEGHGEVQAVPLLLRRLWTEIVTSPHPLEVLKPLREKRNIMTRESDFVRFVELALTKLKTRKECHKGLVLVLLDRDPDPEPPCQIAPSLLDFVRERVHHASISIVIANIEFETWFVAAADSLHKYLELQGVAPIEDPESERREKNWIAGRFKGMRYSETQDQPKLTATMDLLLCRRRSPSFDKLCRDLESWSKPSSDV